MLALPRKNAWDMETVSGLIAGRTTLSKAIDDLEDLTAKTILKKSVNFRPTAKMTTRHKSIGFEKANLDVEHI